MDNIRFQQVIPHPLSDSPISGNIWRTEFTLKKGNKYLIQADSGKGKSTLLNIIYGIRHDFDGSVNIDHFNIATDKSHFNEWRQNHLAYLFQDLRLFAQLTAEENILLKPGCRFNENQIKSYAAALGVEEQLKKPCSKLSLGQQQRIAIIRTLSQPFEWILLDEPFSHLDLENAKKALLMIEEKASEYGAGIIVTSLGENSLFLNYTHLQL